MSRWDGFYDPWFYDYYGYGPYYWRSRMWGWHNPWRYGYYAGWYDPWFDPWYDPWYYGYCGWYGGWYDPWYYGWGGWYGPWYWGGPVIGHVSYGGRNSGGYAGSRTYRYNGDKGYAGNSTYRSNRNRNFGGRINDNGRNNSVRYNNNTNNFDRSNFGGFGNRSEPASEADRIPVVEALAEEAVASEAAVAQGRRLWRKKIVAFKVYG